MSKIPFKVSARTARLIGRENVATAKGALIELVKNCYDADSTLSLIYFDNQYSELSLQLTYEEVEALEKKGIELDRITKVYTKLEDFYVLKNDFDEVSDDDKSVLREQKLALKTELNKFNNLFILDFGEGMTRKIIEDYWMTIGTDNKLANMISRKNRVKAGAKGIGRFALDRLGSKSEMYTFFNPVGRQLLLEESGVNAYKWNVNWEDFEAPSKNIDDIKADLTEISNQSYLDIIDSNIRADISTYLQSIPDTRYGTLLKISDLRDFWDDKAIQETFSDLEVLVPPKETDDFKVVLLSQRQPTKYGEVFSSLCDDFDYKLVATANNNQEVEITLYRNEYDTEAIPDNFFSREGIVNTEKYNKQVFIAGEWKEKVTFAQLLPGFARVDIDDHLNKIGPFIFTFYYMKRAASSPDSARFFYKKIYSNARKDWLNKFGGVKLYRDNFRVRPYGESNNGAFDWLGLGNRKAASPAGVAKPEGGYRVEPENVAGAINISRLTNVNFEDKSSREGLQENATFQVFKALIASIIRRLEDDRSYIAREFAAFDDERFGAAREMERARKLAEEILNRARQKKLEEEEKSANGEGSQDSDSSSHESSGEEALAHLVGFQNEKIERLEGEQTLLRGLASSGIVSASFGHDLSKLSDVFETRIDKLSDLIKLRISEKDYINIEKRKNPFSLLKRIKEQDLKVRNWLNFSLGFTRKDKRKRQQLDLARYFQDFKSDWAETLDERSITLHVDMPENVEMKVFEIDFDSIFSNLLVNSIDAFVFSKLPDNREIFITGQIVGKEVHIEYRDTGPGLDSNILNPDEIFTPLFTTKLDASGEEVGTGLGMWIVKSVIEENDGSIKLLFPEKGFAVRTTFPQKFKTY